MHLNSPSLAARAGEKAQEGLEQRDDLCTRGTNAPHPQTPTLQASGALMIYGDHTGVKVTDRLQTLSQTVRAFYLSFPMYHMTETVKSEGLLWGHRNHSTGLIALGVTCLAILAT